MKDFLKKETKLDLFSGIIGLIIGFILMLIPVEILHIIAYFIEMFFILMGIITVIDFMRVDSKEDFFSFGFIQGMSYILISIFLILNPNLLIVILPVGIGLWMIIGGLKKVQMMLKLSSLGFKVKYMNIIFVILMFTIGIFSIFNPFETVMMIAMLGIGIFIYNFLNIIEDIRLIKFLNNME